MSVVFVMLLAVALDADNRFLEKIRHKNVNYIK
jgi:hypothetical protein